MGSPRDLSRREKEQPRNDEPFGIDDKSDK